jgi:hypothetical protein
MKLDKGKFNYISKLYFKSWEKKNVDIIKSFFSDDIELHQGNNIIVGSDAIIEYNKDALKEEIKMLDIQIYSDEYLKSVVGILKIKIGGDIYDTVEILSFNEENKIKKIVVYS